MVRREPPPRSDGWLRSLDVSQEAPPRDLRPEVRRSSATSTPRSPATSVVLVPNFTAPLDDPAVRRALGTALDCPRRARSTTACSSRAATSSRGRAGLPPARPCPLGDPDEPPDLCVRALGDRGGGRGGRASVRAGGVRAPARYVVRALRKIGLTASRAGARRGWRSSGSPGDWASRSLRRAAGGGHVRRGAQRRACGRDARARRGRRGDLGRRRRAHRGVEGYAIPVGQERRPSFLSDRIDVDTCAVVNPLFGVDLASLCLNEACREAPRTRETLTLAAATAGRLPRYTGISTNSEGRLHAKALVGHGGPVAGDRSSGHIRLW